MKQLSWKQLVSTLEIWRSHNARCFGVFCSTRQFVFTIATIGEISDEQAVVRIAEVVKRLELAPEEPPAEVVLTAADLLAAWQSTTFEQPNAGFVAEVFDELLQITTRGAITSVTLYRASPFRQSPSAG